mmetsp:Transcript_6624/g.4968  ORF Transcript_6624/g.4968 Transcript_6624/m.4968 type:complete len:145 (+) Transcript_6624:154-588(+)
MLMRIVFTAYAIAAALLCFLLTFSLAFLSEQMIEFCAIKLFGLTYILFGPLLMICSFYGVLYIQQILFECTPEGAKSSINFIDVIIILGCTVFSTLITLIFSMEKSIEYASEHLQDENSVFYRMMVHYRTFKRRRREREQRLRE